MERVFNEQVPRAGRQGLSRAEILRGRDSFKDVFTRGSTFRRKHLRGYLLEVSKESNKGTPVRVGFAVNRGLKSAILRNRVRRLMKEAYRRNKEDFVRCARDTGKYFSLVLMYKGADPVALKRLTYNQIEEDVQVTLREASHSG